MYIFHKFWRTNVLKSLIFAGGIFRRNRLKAAVLEGEISGTSYYDFFRIYDKIVPAEDDIGSIF